jgi:hypothetical protein
MEYTTVQASSNNDLIKKVNELIKQGWKPQGGIGITYGSTPFYQAMIRETK